VSGGGPANYASRGKNTPVRPARDAGIPRVRPGAGPRIGDPESAPPATRPEREVLAAILAYLRFVPEVFIFRQNVGAVTAPRPGGGTRLVRFGTPGQPDILGSVTVTASGFGRSMGVAMPLAIEVKSAIGVVRPAQRTILAELGRRGWLVIVARSVADVRDGLRPWVPGAP